MGIVLNVNIILNIYIFKNICNLLILFCEFCEIHGMLTLRKESIEFYLYRNTIIINTYIN